MHDARTLIPSNGPLAPTWETGPRLPAGTLLTSMLVPLVPGQAPQPSADTLRRGLLMAMGEQLCGGDRQRSAPLIARFREDSGRVGHGWSIAPAFRADGGWWTRVVALGPWHAEILLATLAPGAAITPVATTRGTGHGWTRDKRSWRVGAANRWEIVAAGIDDLIGASAQPPGRLRIDLLTPALFRSADGRGDDPLPAVPRLFAAWHRRVRAWVAPWAPSIPDLEEEALLDFAAREVHVVDFSLRARRLELRHGVRTGATGYVTVVAPPPSSPAGACVALLLAVAPYVGTGGKQTAGAGQTLVGPACNPRADPWERMVAHHRNPR